MAAAIEVHASPIPVTRQLNGDGRFPAPGSAEDRPGRWSTTDRRFAEFEMLTQSGYDDRPTAPERTDERPAAGKTAIAKRRSSARCAAILMELHTAGFLTVYELAGRLEVSHMTVRRDLAQLQAGGQVRVVHGGVSLAGAGGGTVPGSVVPGRAATAAMAAGMVAATDTITIDTGPAPLMMAQSLSATFHGTVNTRSLPVAGSVADRELATLRVLGGEYCPQEKAMYGAGIEQQASMRPLGVLFMSCAGIDPTGVFVDTSTDRSAKAALMNGADRVVLLADQSALDVAGRVRLSSLERVSMVITSCQPSGGLIHALSSANVELLIANR